MSRARRFRYVFLLCVSAGLIVSCTRSSEQDPASNDTIPDSSTVLFKHQKDMESTRESSTTNTNRDDPSSDLRIGVSLLPELPRAGEQFQAVVRPLQDDSHLYLDYQWLVNDQEIPDAKEGILNRPVVRGDKVSVRVTPSQGSTTGIPVTVSRHVLNSPPIVESLSGTSFDGVQYRTHLKASDPDKDPLEFAILEGPKGMQIDSQGFITWQPAIKDMGRHKVVVSVKDGQEGELVYTYDFTLRTSQEASRTE